jgi:hypothetical protein
VNLEGIYDNLCRSGDPEAALAKLGDTTLAALLRHLDAAGIHSGIPGLMLAMAEKEAGARFVTDRIGSEGAVGEENL